MRIILATTNVEAQHRILTELGITDRLISYWFIQDQPPAFLGELASTGFLPKTPPKRRSTKPKTSTRVQRFEAMRKRASEYDNEGV